jgi:hypothetical protein
MRTAYSGRAAAYEKKGDYASALADHDMAVLYYAIEAEVLGDVGAADRVAFLEEAARAYLARARCLEQVGRDAAALADRKRAEALQGDAKKVATAPPTVSAGGSGEARVINAWSEAVTLVAAGVNYRLGVGEQKAIPAPAGTVACELVTGPSRQVWTLQAGKTYTIHSPSP